MSNDPLDEMVRISANDAAEEFAARVARERLRQDRARRHRKIARRTMYTLVALSASSWLAGGLLESDVLLGMACILSPLTLIAILVAFLLGTYAPPDSLDLLSDREKEMLWK